MRAAESRDDRDSNEDGTMLAQAAAEELLLLGSPRVNVMLRGTDEVIRRILATLLDRVEQPIARWSPGQPFVLPPVEETGTLVLHEVGALRVHDQIQLLGWSTRAVGTTQVISTTSAPLVPRISAGAFIDTLYYRLNTVYLDASGEEDEVVGDV